MRCRTSPGRGTRPARSTTAVFVSSPTRCSALGWGTSAGDEGRCPTTGPGTRIWPLCRICTPIISTSGRFPSCRATFRWWSRAARCAPCPVCDGCATVNWSRSPRATRSAWGTSSSRRFRLSMTATGGPGLGSGHLRSGTSSAGRPAPTSPATPTARPWCGRRLGVATSLSYRSVAGAPGWVPGTCDAVRAAGFLAELDAHHAVPVHFGTMWPIGLGPVRHDRFNRPGTEFTLQAARLGLPCSVRELQPGETARLALPDPRRGDGEPGSARPGAGEQGQ